MAGNFVRITPDSLAAGRRFCRELLDDTWRIVPSMPMARGVAIQEHLRRAVEHLAAARSELLSEEARAGGWARLDGLPFWGRIDGRRAWYAPHLEREDLPEVGQAVEVTLWTPAPPDVQRALCRMAAAELDTCTPGG